MTGGADAHQGLLVSGRFPELEDALCERVAELKRGDALAPVTVVVGSAAVRTRVGDLVVRRLGAVANLTVATLGRLAADLVAADARGSAGRAQRASPASGSCGASSAAWPASSTTSGPVLDRPHFAQALAATLTDLREACVPPDSAWSDGGCGRRVRPRAGGPSRRSDLDRLYRAFCAELDVTAACWTAPACSRRRPPPWPRAAVMPGAVVLYGVYDLNQAQEAFVRALIEQRGGRVRPRAAPTVRGPALTTLEVAAALGLAEQRLAPAPAGPRPGAAAGGLARGVRGRAARRSRGDGSLAVVSVSDERAELREAVRAVLGRGRGRRGRLGLRAGRAARRRGRARGGGAPQEAGLPVACRVPDRSAGARLLTRLADCLAPPAGEPFSRRAVIDLLAAGPLRDGGEAGRDGAVAGRGPAGRRGGRARAVDDAPGAPPPRPGAAARRPRGAGRRRRSTTTTRCPARSRRCGSASRRCAGSRPRRARSSRACGRPPGARHAGATWAEFFAGAVAAVFDAGGRGRGARRRLPPAGARPSSTRRSTSARRRPCCASMLARARVPHGRVGRDGVAVLTPLELRGLSFHTVVFTGLAEGGFPARGRPDPLLGDAERRRVGAGARRPAAAGRAARRRVAAAVRVRLRGGARAARAARAALRRGRRAAAPAVAAAAAAGLRRRPAGPSGSTSSSTASRCGRSGAGSPARRPSPTTRSGWTSASATPRCCSRSRRGQPRAPRARTPPRCSATRTRPSRRFGAWRSAQERRCRAPWDGLLGARRPRRARGHAPVRRRDAPHAPRALRQLPVRLPAARRVRARGARRARRRARDGRQGVRHAGARHPAARLRAGHRRRPAPGRGPGRGARGVGDVLRRGRAPRRHRGGALVGGPPRAAARGPARDGAPRPRVRRTRRAGPSASSGASARRWAGRSPSSCRAAARCASPAVSTASTRPPSGARVIDYKTGAGGTERSRIKEGLSVQLPVYQLARAPGRRTRTTRPSPACTGSSRAAAASRTSTCRRREEASERRLRELVASAVALVDAGLFPRTTRQRCDYCDVRYACGVSGLGQGAQARARRCSSPVCALQSAAVRGGRRCRLSGRVCDQDVRDRVTTDLGTTFLLEAGRRHRQDPRARRPLRELRPRPRARAPATCARWRPSRSRRRQPASCASASARSSSGWRSGPPATPRARPSSRARSTLSTTRPSAPSTASPAACCASSRSRPGVDPAFEQLDALGSDLERGRLWEEWLRELAAGDPADGTDPARLVAAAARRRAARLAAGARRRPQGRLRRALRPRPRAPACSRSRTSLGGTARAWPVPLDQAGRVLLRRLQQHRRQGLRRRDGLVEAGRALLERPPGGRRPAGGGALRAAGQGHGHARPAAPRATGTRRTAARTSCRPGTARRSRRCWRPGRPTPPSSPRSPSPSPTRSRAGRPRRSSRSAASTSPICSGCLRDLLVARPRPPGRRCRRASATCWSTSSRTPTRCRRRSSSSSASASPRRSDWRDVVLEPGKLFVVGDPKQSIYRFRRADIGMYDQVQAPGRGAAGRHRGGRGHPPELPHHAGGGAVGQQRVRGRVRRRTRRRAASRATSGWSRYRPPAEGPRVAVLLGDDYGTAAGAADAARQAEAQALAALLARDARRGAAPLDRAGSRAGRAGGDGEAWRPPRWGDVALLFRATTGLETYEQAFREAGVPYRVDGGKAYFARREVDDALLCLRAVDDPSDGPAVYGALHSTFFGFSDDELFLFWAAGGRFDLFAGAAGGARGGRRGARRRCAGCTSAAPRASRTSWPPSSCGSPAPPSSSPRPAPAAPRPSPTWRSSSTGRGRSRARAAAASARSWPGPPRPATRPASRSRRWTTTATSSTCSPSTRPRGSSTRS